METKIIIKICELLSIESIIRSFEIVNNNLVMSSEEPIKSNSKFSVMTSEQYAQIYYHTIVPSGDNFYSEMYYYLNKKFAQQLCEIWNGIKSPGYNKIITMYDYCSGQVNKQS